MTKELENPTLFRVDLQFLLGKIRNTDIYPSNFTLLPSEK
ncbi:hypothetical protein TW70_01122 [Streptococcus cristatus]|nr:hypothetical protein TW70_01122 [Streptococcus cristatus]